MFSWRALRWLEARETRADSLELRGLKETTRDRAFHAAAIKMQPRAAVRIQVCPRGQAGAFGAVFKGMTAVRNVAADSHVCIFRLLALCYVELARQGACRMQCVIGAEMGPKKRGEVPSVGIILRH